MAKSIIHDKNDRTCYLCMKLNSDYGTRTGLEEHHVIFGTGNRRLSEKYGLKVYLCVPHHRGYGAQYQSAHFSRESRELLCREAQRAFEEKYSHEEWMRVFGRCYREGGDT